MKTIDDLKLDNMVLIEKYLNNKLSEKDVKAFLKRLASDVELQEDYEMVKDVLLKEQKSAGGTLEMEQTSLKHYDNGQFKVSRKGWLGKELINNGLVSVLAMVLMVLTCALIILIMA